MKVGEAVRDWAAETLIVPAGHPDAGKPLLLPAYIVRFFDDLYADGVIEGGLSLSRKNVKSTGGAVLILYFLCGPGYVAGWRGAVMATNGQTAGVMLDLIKALIESSNLQVESRYAPQPGKLIASNADAECQFYNASKSAALGANLSLAIADEYGEFEESARRNVEMLLSSFPLRPQARLIGMGVQAHSHLFQEMKARADRPTTVWHEYVGHPAVPVDDIESIMAGNPAIAAGIMPVDGLLKAAQRAKGVPATEYEFRKYHLNLPSQESKDVLISLPDYRRNVIVPDLPPRDGMCSLGVDIGYSESQTAACAYWSATGRLEVYGAMPSIPTAAARGLSDGVGDLYEACVERGELELHPGRVTDVHYFMRMLADKLAGESVEMVADDYRTGEVVGAMEALGLQWQVDFRRVGRGRDNLRDIIDTQKLLMSGKVKTTENLLLMNAIRFATLRFSSSNNFCELVKYKSNSRIDAASALVLSLGHGARQLEAPKREMSFFVV